MLVCCLTALCGLRVLHCDVYSNSDLRGMLVADRKRKARPKEKESILAPQVPLKQLFITTFVVTHSYVSLTTFVRIRLTSSAISLLVTSFLKQGLTLNIIRSAPLHSVCLVFCYVFSFLLYFSFCYFLRYAQSVSRCQTHFTYIISHPFYHFVYEGVVSE